jgi:hypothetical protein
MNSIDLQTPFLDGAIRSVNFFNGRLLTARDLIREQAANREGHLLLGQTVGEGVAYGLEVSKSSADKKEAPVVTVEAGLALNRRGQTLALPSRADIALSRQFTISGGTTIFSECLPLQSGTYVAGAGVYLLTLAPAQTTEGRAPASGLDGATASCNTDSIVTAVQFRLIQLDPPLSPAELQDQDHLRNHIAYRCFGVTDTKAFARDPFGPAATKYGLLDQLRDNQLTDCDVPLAILYWTQASGIKFIDNWSARRVLTERSAIGRWSLPFAPRRRSETQAMFLQFQDQVDDIRNTETNIAALNVSQRFQFLPPIGFLPVIGPGSPVGFNAATFFGSFASNDVAMTDGELLRDLMHDALYYEPIDLSLPNKIQLYTIWENVRAVEQGQSNQLAVVFATHALPYRGVARFGRARWTLSRFAPAVL